MALEGKSGQSGWRQNWVQRSHLIIAGRVNLRALAPSLSFFHWETASSCAILARIGQDAHVRCEINQGRALPPTRGRPGWAPRAPSLR